MRPFAPPLDAMRAAPPPLAAHRATGRAHERMKARPRTIVMVLIIVAIVAGLGYLAWPALS